MRLALGVLGVAVATAPAHAGRSQRGHHRANGDAPNRPCVQRPLSRACAQDAARVRNAIAYVLNNWRRHNQDKLPVASTWRLDPYSSGIQFSGWKELEGRDFMYGKPPTYQELIVWLPRTWLLSVGWRRHGLIRADEVPGPLERTHN